MSNQSTKHKIILIKKASGEEEPFSTEKLVRSLRNAGARHETISEIVAHIENWIYPGITTKKIYAQAFSMLQEEKTSSSLRYRLKQAIYEMGPTGYPFEILIGKLFRHLGYQTEVGVVVDGKCVTHEMDVIATLNHVQNLVECKYHKDQGKQVSVQVPLYVRSRVNDIIEKRQSMPQYQEYSFKGWVVTNTQFSNDSTRYGLCSGLNLLGWSYPEGNGLKENIEKFKLYPITILKRLTVKEKQFLLGQGIVTCLQAFENPDLLNDLNLSAPKYNALMNELKDICS